MTAIIITITKMRGALKAENKQNQRGNKLKEYKIKGACLHDLCVVYI